MIAGLSLRSRLLVLILTPLAIIACLLGYWRYTVGLATAEELFDRSLLATTLAISRDVTVSGGDALSITTRDLLAEAAGGQVFYHVAGPDRAYLTGYAYPPVPPAREQAEASRPLFYESLYHDLPVRALRLLEPTDTDGFKGLSAVTVWQQRADRQAFAQALAVQSAVLLGALVLALAVVTWLAVNRGLRPLLDLEHAIAIRSSDDLKSIERTVPPEVRGIVARLNELFAQVAESMRARDVFISNAAHQLRNPVAGMLALAEAAEGAGSELERGERLRELRSAAERTARLTTQMLALERVRAGSPVLDVLDLGDLVERVAARNATRILNAGIKFDYSGPTQSVYIRGDAVMLEEVLENLLDNAMVHGGLALSCIEVTLRRSLEHVALVVADDGAGLKPEHAAVALDRFGQVGASHGSGLGLSIVAEVARAHGAKLAIETVDEGASLSVRFDVCAHARPAS